MDKEKIKKQIDLEMEELKFYQGFFLPIGSGIIASFLTKSTLGIFISSSLIILGILFLFFLYLRRGKTIRNIKSLIEKL